MRICILDPLKQSFQHQPLQGDQTQKGSAKTCHYAKVCMQQHFQKVYHIVSGPEYQGLNIHQEDDYPMNDNYGVYT